MIGAALFAFGVHSALWSVVAAAAASVTVAR
jgi:hypothetical protein